MFRQAFDVSASLSERHDWLWLIYWGCLRPVDRAGGSALCDEKAVGAVVMMLPRCDTVPWPEWHHSQMQTLGLDVVLSRWYLVSLLGQGTVSGL